MSHLCCTRSVHASTNELYSVEHFICVNKSIPNGALGCECVCVCVHNINQFRPRIISIVHVNMSNVRSYAFEPLQLRWKFYINFSGMSLRFGFTKSNVKMRSTTNTQAQPNPIACHRCHKSTCTEDWPLVLYVIFILLSRHNF